MIHNICIVCGQLINKVNDERSSLMISHGVCPDSFVLNQNRSCREIYELWYDVAGASDTVTLQEFAKVIRNR
jgi:hypothetical protein